MKLQTVVLKCITIALCQQLIASWSSSADTTITSRRQAFVKAVAIATPVIGITLLSDNHPSYAGIAGDNEPRVTSRMGGLLESFQDGPRGIRMMAPSGWNKFEGEVGAYDIKWQDLVDPTENVKISSTPVKSTTESVEVLGPVKEVGIKLAASRNAKLVSASDRLTEGIVFYTFDFAINDGTHQLLVLCVSKGKLWSLDCNSKEKKWAKREEMYKAVAGSFVPKLSLSS